MTEQPDLKPNVKDEGDIFSSQLLASTSKDSSREGSSSSHGGYGVKDELDVKPGSSSAAATPGRGRKKGPQPLPVKPVMIDDLPIANDEALQTFEELDKCVYEFKRLGMSMEQDEMMVCDCVYDRDDPDAEPCGTNSDCINRAIFIECLADECRARSHCQNQRFTKKQYADIDVVQTELKGFGLRAASDIPSGGLIYEYIGEVVAEQTFRKRMKQYASEGIKHFYFMMLQKDEYLDATKKGGIGRFANHSCNPNCEVQKWVVGRRLRMGIFSKRDILKGEEVTFNYNVDRYGHDAQICYCGEPNCVGFIGGKTQTDIGGMNDLFLDALGITDEVEINEMRGTKKKKSRQMDGDFVPTLRPIHEEEITKVAAAMRQSMENPSMMSKLLQRVKMTDEPVLQRKLMGMHGFSLMCMILTQLAENRDVILLALESMDGWKPLTRNKIEDSKVEEPVKILSESSDEDLSAIAKRLLTFWSTLELSYRIPRVSRIANLDADDEAATSTIAEADLRTPMRNENRRPVALDAWENNNTVDFTLAPVRRPVAPSFARPQAPIPPPTAAKLATPMSSYNDRSKLDAIIALAQQTVQAASIVPSASVATSPAAESSRSSNSGRNVFHNDWEESQRKKAKRSHHRDEDSEGRKKEKALTKLVGDVVVRAMSKYKEQMEHETFKRYAKECTMLLVDKEKKGSTFLNSKHPTLSEEKKAKMKQFTKDYTHKLLKKLKDKGKLIRIPKTSTPSSSVRHPSSTSTSTPNSHTQENADKDLVSEMFDDVDDHPDDDLERDQDIEMRSEIETQPSSETPITPSDHSTPVVIPIARHEDSWVPPKGGLLRGIIKNGGVTGEKNGLAGVGNSLDTPSSSLSPR